MVDAVDRARRLFFSLEGRAGRGAWWLGTISLALVGEAAGLLPATTATVAGFLLIYPQICVDGKRLHDHGRGAWWQTPLVLLSLPQQWVGGYARLGSMVDDGFDLIPIRVLTPIMVLTIVGLIVTLLFYLVYFGVLRGTQGPNRFDPPASAIADFFA